MSFYVECFYVTSVFLTKVYICIHPNNLTVVCMWITWIREKKTLEILVKTFFFGLHLICWREKNRGRGSSPPMLKIGQNWGRIANYSPSNAQQRSAPLQVRNLLKFKNPLRFKILFQWISLIPISAWFLYLVLYWNCFWGYDKVFDSLNLLTKSIGVKENLISEIFRVSCICWLKFIDNL